MNGAVMNSPTARVIHTNEVQYFKVDDSYSSRMLLDDFVAGEAAVHINEGTLKGDCDTPGATHELPEIYYVIKGEAVLHLGGLDYDISAGSLAYIPAGTFHALHNKSQAEDFIILTIWKSTSGNEVYQKRLEAWGTSFKTIYDE
jgi:quercetin dioxygenase-like cupin family protein